MQTLSFSGRYRANTDLRWVGQNTTTGSATETYTANYGTGVDPNPPADAMGQLVKAGQQITEVNTRLDRTLLTITAASVALIHQALDGTETVLWRALDIALDTAARLNTAFRQLSTPIDIPADGVLFAAVRPVGVVAAQDYIYAVIEAVVGEATGGSGMSGYELAKTEGRVFTAGTGMQNLSDVKQNLNITFTNPSGSGKVITIEHRILAGNRPSDDFAMEAFFIPTPNPLIEEECVDVTVSRPFGGTEDPVGEFCYSISETRLDTTPSIQTPTAFVVPNSGVERYLAVGRKVLPGESTGIFVNGGGYARPQDRVSVSFVWYEEDE